MSDFDAIVVGAGCAGSVAAYTLASAGKSVLVVERGQYAGAKNMTGGRIYTHSLAKVFPNYQEAPLQRKVTHERISLMSPDSNFTIDYAARELEEAVRSPTPYCVAPLTSGWQSRLKMLVLNLFTASQLKTSLLKMVR